MTIDSPIKVAYLTAGAAGMFCGSCMHDNALAGAMIELGHDVQLIPLYTPIRTDEENISVDQVFFGGINIYLKQKYSFLRGLPRWMTSWLDSPAIINFASGLGIETKASQLGSLTVTMLRGSEDFQRRETERLADWLQADEKPHVVVFSNMLTAGCVPDLKSRLGTPVVVTLQGDDIFLSDLLEPFRTQALNEIKRLDKAIDGYIVPSRYYADHMAVYLGLPLEKFHIVPLGLTTSDFQADRVPIAQAETTSIECERPPRVGYLARLAPEKGLHVLGEAFALLRQMPGMERAELWIAGWRGPQHRKYIAGVLSKLDAAGCHDAVRLLGEVDRRGKLDLLRSVDVLSVPTVYREPKGLFVLEALAAGLPVVQPSHGSFPEMIEELGGGLLHRPEDPQHLAERLHELLSDRQKLKELGYRGQQAVNEQRSAQSMARRTVEVLRTFLTSTKQP
jgi:glycosyltransferase involved in cell wall biosynthesis